MTTVLIADSGSTKCEWLLLEAGKKKKIFTTGISPYFLNAEQITALLKEELLPKIKNAIIDEIFFYGTGLKDNANKRFIHTVLKKSLSICTNRSSDRSFRRRKGFKSN